MNAATRGPRRTRALACALLALAAACPAGAHPGGHHRAGAHPATEPDAPPTPAQAKIAAARAAVAADPDRAEAYPPLAFALAARARETADGSFYEQAMDAVGKSLGLEADNFAARKAEAWVLLGQHEFQKALERARALTKRSGDDAMVWAMLTDAAIETGRYREAEKAAQWALDLDPGGVPGLTRAAYLREHFGDFDGAIELMKLAFNRTRATETEDRAWLLTHIGQLYLLKGEPATAARAHLEALELFPGYHYALLHLAHTRAAQGDHDAALDLHRQHHAAAPHPESLYQLGLALRRAGKTQEAQEAFADFERDALAWSDRMGNSNRELVAYYIDVADRPARALEIAAGEMARRQDFRTRHAFARALHATGEFQRAHSEMRQALEVGVRYPEVQLHAGIIAHAAGDIGLARKHLRGALAQAPQGPVAEHALAALGALDR